MEVVTHSLFPVPLTVTSFGNEARDLNKRLVKDAFTERTHVPTRERTGIGAFQSKLGMEEKYESYKILAQNIHNVIKSVLPKYGWAMADINGPVVTKGLWVNIIEGNGGFHMPHTHGSGSTFFSGVYYPTSGLDFNGNDIFPFEDLSKPNELRPTSRPNPGDLVLFDPARAIKQQVYPPRLNFDPYYGCPFALRPKEGTLVIFPNYLEHMVAPVIDDVTRMSISFTFRKI